MSRAGNARPKEVEIRFSNFPQPTVSPWFNKRLWRYSIKFDSQLALWVWMGTIRDWKQKIQPFIEKLKGEGYDTTLIKLKK